MSEETIVRQNLMDDPNYRPYCGSNNWTGSKLECNNPRTIWTDNQFKCPNCGWVSQFPKDFIDRYKQKHGL
jgi:hypothetical protein